MDRYWTPEMDQALIAGWDATPTEELAVQISKIKPVTAKSTQQRASRLRQRGVHMSFGQKRMKIRPEWTPTMDAFVLEHRGKKSSEEMARELTTPDFPITRNGVIGRIARLRKELGLPKTVREREVRAKRVRSVPFRIIRSERIAPQSIIAAPPLNLSLFDLKPDHCRYPVTDDSPFLFCGHPKDERHPSYCAAHAELCRGEAVRQGYQQFKYHSPFHAIAKKHLGPDGESFGGIIAA